jgi:HEAT repeat protein
MLESHTGSLLVDYYETFLRDHDVDAFRNHVSARYLEGTLARLVDSPNVQARRAAVFALGLCGTIDANAAVAKALKDADPTVRRLGENALWAIWFRADSPANNAALEKVAALIAQRAPGFAEAYNQRAIAEFFLGRFKASADDCKLVLARNPYHTGALAGMARCLLQLEQREEAIKTFRRASRLQPHNIELRQMISALESGYP